MKILKNIESVYLIRKEKKDTKAGNDGSIEDFFSDPSAVNGLSIGRRSRNGKQKGMGVVRPEDCIPPPGLKEIPGVAGGMISREIGDKIAQLEGYEKKGGDDDAVAKVWQERAKRAASQMQGKGEGYERLKAKLDDLKLVQEVENDIRKFIKQQEELLFNEFDFQMQLAIYLRMTNKYDDVDVEYYMPTKKGKKKKKDDIDSEDYMPAQNTNILEGYDLDSNMRVDIVVRHGNEYVPIELKYVTKKVVRDKERFGKLIKGMEILRDQAAQDIRRYDFWKDVRRIELIKKNFPAVKNGFAVFLTNDPSYKKDPRSTAVCYPFSMSGERIIGGADIDWNGNPAASKDHKSFRLEGGYKLLWDKTSMEDVQFDYTILKI